MSWRRFQERFSFNKSLRYHVGIERERFLVDAAGVITPASDKVLEHLPSDGRFGPELSACQIEDRVGPCSIQELGLWLEQNDLAINDACRALQLSNKFLEVAPATMPVAVYPDPVGRYQRIAIMLGSERLLAACRVAGTHIHVGMPDADTALRVYNGVVRHHPLLMATGDHSDGERLRLYNVVAPNTRPRPYESWEEFAEVARAKGFFENPRDCWDLIRLSVHGTIEFRVFGVSENLYEIELWARICRMLCQSVQ